MRKAVEGGGLRRLAAVCVVVFAGVLSAPASALAAGSISGTVTASSDHEPIAEVEVCAEGVGLIDDFACAETGIAGTYTIPGLEAGNHKVEFWPAVDSNFSPQYYSGKTSWGQADLITVANDADTPGIDAALDEGGWVEGQVVDALSKAGLGGIVVCARPIDETGFTRCVVSDVSGGYSIVGLATDSYEVGFFPVEEAQSEYLTQYYKGKSFSFEATPVAVTAGSGVSAVDAEMKKGGQIAGTVTDAASGAGIRFAVVCALEALEGEIFTCVYTDGSGHYAIEGLPTGSYKVWFSPDVPEWEEEDDYVQQYYSGKPNFAQADPLTVVAPGVTSGIDERLVSRKTLPAAPVGAPTAIAPTAPPVLASVAAPKPLRCKKGKRKVTVKGKPRCVKIHRKRHHRPR